MNILHFTCYIMLPNWMCIHSLNRIYWNIACMHTSHMFKFDSGWRYFTCTHNLYKTVPMLCTYHVCIHVYISCAGLRDISNSQLLWQWKPMNKHVCFMYMYSRYIDTKSTFPDEFSTSIWGVACGAASWGVAWRAKIVVFDSISCLPCVHRARTARKSAFFQESVLDLNLTIWWWSQWSRFCCHITEHSAYQPLVLKIDPFATLSWNQSITN